MISFLARLHRVHYGLLGLRFRSWGIEPFAPVLASMQEIVLWLIPHPAAENAYFN
jgi:hypothetical protein